MFFNLILHYNAYHKSAPFQFNSVTIIRLRSDLYILLEPLTVIYRQTNGGCVIAHVTEAERKAAEAEEELKPSAIIAKATSDGKDIQAGM